MNVDSPATLEKIREVLSHPISSITDTIHHVMSSSTKDESEISHSDVVDNENKTLFETIRETITSPIVTLTEKVQQIISKPTESEDQVELSAVSVTIRREFLLIIVL